MILTELTRLYDRLADMQHDNEPLVPPYGFSIEKVSFCLIVRPDGELVRVEDVRDHAGTRPVPVSMDVPLHWKRPGSGVTPFFLCDNSAYLLGADAKGNLERSAACHAASLQMHAALAEKASDDSQLQAVAAFLKQATALSSSELDYYDELIAGGNIVFRVDGHRFYVHQTADATRLWMDWMASAHQGVPKGTCLVTGESGPIAAVHPAIKGVRGGQSTGVSIVSFNLDAFCSYGKSQGYNAPISDSAAFKYVAALNHLTADYKHRIQIADSTTVFWAERHTPFESVFQIAFSGDFDGEGDDAVRVQLLRLRDGKPLDQIDEDVRFFVLGLAPNSARASVRFWLRDTVGTFARHLSEHLSDCAIERQYENQHEIVPIWQLVNESARRYVGSGRERKTINGDPNPMLASALTRAVLTGVEYPRTLLAAFVGRVRADGEVNYVRMSAIKAVISRRRRRNQKEEVPMALQKDFQSTGYQLGRLFAALERAQRAALGEINATIKDRYFGAASSTPARVFPILLRLSQHHIAKADWGRAADRTIAEIVDGITEFPKYLNLEEQGLFAIGYYHQRNEFFKRKEEREVANG